MHVQVDIITGADKEEHWNFSLSLRKSEHYVDNSRKLKREITFTKKHCVANVEVRRNQAQRAEVIDVGDTVRLPCRLCDAVSSKNIRDAHLWFKFWRYINDADQQIAWKVLEVQTDMHDDENLNRVLVLPDHTLVIKDFQPNDAGTYFCEHYLLREERLTKLTFTSSDHGEASAIALGLVWKKLAHDYGVDFLFHLDVTVPSSQSLVISQDSTFRYAKPSKPRVFRSQNVVLFTEWSAWSECSTCGRKAEKRRVGRCKAQRWNNEEVTSSEYLDYVFFNFPDGVPCHSSLFVKYNFIVKSVNEVEVATCYVACAGGDNMQSLMELEKKENDDTRRKEDKLKGNELFHEVFHAKPSEALVLSCPLSRPHNTVAWFNGTELLLAMELAESSNSRVVIDATQSLYFKSIIPSDKGNYTCFIDGVKKAKFMLNLENESNTDILFYLNLLLFTYGVDFVIFIVCMCTKYLKVSK